MALRLRSALTSIFLAFFTLLGLEGFTKTHVYILFGQSNMAGTPQPETIDLKTNPRIRVLSYSDCIDGRMYNEITTARTPLHQCGGGVGPGDYFGRTMANAYAFDTILIVPCAISGVDIDFFRKGVKSKLRDNFPIPPNNLRMSAYEMVIEKAQIAQQLGEIEGILMVQGESDVTNANWEKYVSTIVSDFRADLGLTPSSCPFLIGKLLPGSYFAAQNPRIDNIANNVPYAMAVSSDGLTGESDLTHYNLSSQRIFGKRFADRLLSFLTDVQCTIVSPKNAVTLKPNDTLTIEVVVTVSSSIVSKVKLYDNDTLVDSLSNAPYNFRVLAKPGKHIYRAVAFPTTKFPVGSNVIEASLDLKNPVFGKVAFTSDYKSVNASWPAASDDAGVKYYLIKLNGDSLAITPNLDFSYDKLVPNTLQKLTFEAVDFVGRHSNVDTITFSTKALPTADQLEEILTIDGNLDETQWTFPYIISKLNDGRSDNKSRFGVLWDSTYLYVGLVVGDRNLANDGGQIWQNDGAEFYFDANYNRASSFDAFDRQFTKGWNTTTVSEINNKIQGVLHGYATIDTGYTIEMAIPWSNVGYVNGQTGLVGFDITVNDDEFSGLREGSRVWQGNGSNYFNTSAYGEIKMLGTVPIVSLSFSNPDTIYAKKGDTVQLSYSISPAASSFKTVLLSSTNIAKAKIINGNKLVVTGTSGSCKVVVKALDRFVSDTLVVSVSTITGLENSYLDDIVIYPNPFSEKLTIDHLGDGYTFEIKNVFGHEVWLDGIRKGETLEIETGRLKSGVYFISLEDKTGARINYKILKL